MAETLTIERLGHRGDGVAATGAGALYVPFALAGERVVADPGEGGRARLVEVVAASPDRVAPYCPHAGTCGGCAVQHLRQDAALAWKRDLVEAALTRAGLAAEVASTIDAHGRGRRRVTLHARIEGGGRPRVGFMTARSHALVDLAGDPCPLLVPALRRAVPAVGAVATALRGIGKPLDAVVTATLGGLDVDLRGAGRVREAERLALARIAEEVDLARLALHGETVVERRPPAVSFDGIEVVPPPGGFLQATEAGEAALAALVVAAVGKARRVADLFCGTGTFALRLARTAQVTAVESDAASLAALDRGARRAGGLRPVTALRRDLFRRPLAAAELDGFEAVVFDPPRAGALAVAAALAASQVPRVVAVSCNPDTLARDLAILVRGGYRLGAVTPIDQFRHAAHVEAVAVLAR